LVKLISIISQNQRLHSNLSIKLLHVDNASQPVLKPFSSSILIKFMHAKTMFIIFHCHGTNCKLYILKIVLLCFHMLTELLILRVITQCEHLSIVDFSLFYQNFVITLLILKALEHSNMIDYKY